MDGKKDAEGGNERKGDEDKKKEKPKPDEACKKKKEENNSPSTNDESILFSFSSESCSPEPDPRAVVEDRPSTVEGARARDPDTFAADASTEMIAECEAALSRAVSAYKEKPKTPPTSSLFDGWIKVGSQEEPVSFEDLFREFSNGDLTLLQDPEKMEEFRKWCRRKHPEKRGEDPLRNPDFLDWCRKNQIPRKRYVGAAAAARFNSYNHAAAAADGRSPSSGSRSEKASTVPADSQIDDDDDDGRLRPERLPVAGARVADWNIPDLHNVEYRPDSVPPGYHYNEHQPLLQNLPNPEEESLRVPFDGDLDSFCGIFGRICERFCDKLCTTGGRVSALVILVIVFYAFFFSNFEDCLARYCYPVFPPYFTFHNRDPLPNTKYCRINNNIQPWFDGNLSVSHSDGDKLCRSYGNSMIWPIRNGQWEFDQIISQLITNDKLSKESNPFWIDIQPLGHCPNGANRENCVVSEALQYNGIVCNFTHQTGFSLLTGLNDTKKCFKSVLRRKDSLMQFLWYPADCLEKLAVLCVSYGPPRFRNCLHWPMYYFFEE